MTTRPCSTASCCRRIALGKDLRPLRIVSDLSVSQDRFGFAVIEVPE